jgi:hypothetical protein
MKLKNPFKGLKNVVTKATPLVTKAVTKIERHANPRNPLNWPPKIIKAVKKAGPSIKKALTPKPPSLFRGYYGFGPKVSKGVSTSESNAHTVDGVSWLHIDSDNKSEWVTDDNFLLV